MKDEIRIVAVSGGFDPVHIGHARMFEEARKLGTHLVVILNGDAWLKRKKGFAFMPQDERAELIKKFTAVDDVYIHESDDSHVADALRDYTMNINGTPYPIAVFANGGDRKNEDDIPEAPICKEKNIEMIFNVGAGGKVQSSSWLTDALAKKTVVELDERPWGKYEVFLDSDTCKVKRITVKEGERLSYQRHQKRSEHWLVIRGEGVVTLDDVESPIQEGSYIEIPVGTKHRVKCTGNQPLVFIEVQTGSYFGEDDIERFEDDYGRK